MARLAGAAASSSFSKQAAAQGTRARNSPAVFIYRISVSYHVTCNASMRNATCGVMMRFLSLYPTHTLRTTHDKRITHDKRDAHTPQHLPFQRMRTTRPLPQRKMAKKMTMTMRKIQKMSLQTRRQAGAIDDHASDAAGHSAFIAPS